MSGYECHVVTGHLIGDCDRLLRVTRIVADLQLELFAEHPTGCVDIGDCRFATRRHLGAERRVLSRLRTGDGNLDHVWIFLATTARQSKCTGGNDDQSSQAHYAGLPSM